MKKLQSVLKFKLFFGALAIAMVFAISGLTFVIREVPVSTAEIGNGQYEITVGNIAYASETPDYTCDGIADDAQFQAALNALPATGGKIRVLSGNFVFVAQVTRAIDNVTIEGTGRGTYFALNGANPMWAAGGNNWVFQDLRTDAGGINMGATTGWQWKNVTINATFYADRSPTGQSIFNDATVASLTDSGLTSGRIPIAGAGGLLSDDGDLTFSGTKLSATALDAPVGRGVTLSVAANDSTTLEKEQSDYVCDGTDDEEEIQDAIDALPATGGIIHLCSGQFNVDADVILAGYAASLAVPSYTTIEGTGYSTYLYLNDNQTAAVQYTSIIMNDAPTVGNTNITIRNLRLDANKANQAPAPGDPLDWECINLKLVTNSCIQNCWTANAEGDGIDLDDSTYNLIEGNQCNTNNGFGIHLSTNSNYNRVISNYTYSNGATGNRGGYDTTTGTEGNQFIGNTSNADYRGIDIRGDRCIVSGNSIFNNTNATADEGALQIWAGVNNTITANVIYNAKKMGIRILTGDRNIISNNVISITGGTAISNAGGAYCQIIGNQIRSAGSNGITCAGTKGVISDNVLNTVAADGISTSASGTQITNNRLILISGKGIDNAGYEDILIRGNYLESVTGTPIVYTSKYVTVEGNFGFIAPGERRFVSGSLTAGNANAICFYWHSHEIQDVFIKKVVIEVVTGGGTVGSHLDVGIADDAAGTNRGTEFFNDLLLNDVDINDSWVGGDGGTQTKWVFCQDSVSATDGWIVGQILDANAASLVGKYYIEYVGR